MNDFSDPFTTISAQMTREFNDFEKIIKRSIHINDHEKIQKKLRDEFVQNNTKPSSDLCAEFIANKINSIE